ncbi:MAG: hypothetical protein ABFD79_12330 [Phycisphaerales bacterium]
MNEADIQEIITDAISDQDGITRVRTFEEAGVLTTNNGLVIRTEDGSEFQITIIQSR